MPSIILVRPQMGENIGAAARVMDNFGLDDLRIVDPRDGWPNEKAEEMAAHAAPLIAKAKIYDSMADAVADRSYVYAATARPREANIREVSLPDCAFDQADSAILFGPERSGLTNDDLTHAHQIVTIPTNPKNPSLNLAQAVAVIAYQCSAVNESPDSSQEPLATGEDLQYFFNQLEAELSQKGFFRVPEKTSHMKQQIRHMLMRADLTSQELRILHGVIRALK